MIKLKNIFKPYSQKKIDFLICGLGNPTPKYQRTRHNVGFMALDLIAEKYSTGFTKQKFKSLVAEAVIGDRRCLLIKPQTFMNNSGQAVREALSYYKLPVNSCLIIFDDTTLDIGSLRIRRNGSDGGHNGMKSIIAETGSEEFMRIKIGIGKKPHPDYDLAKWVLSDFDQDSLKKIEPVLARAVEASELIVQDKLVQAMNLYNRTPK